MILKSLNLRGFKTFADTTEIEFGNNGARITAVVGPNGCGKSNLLDAMRWVLGEDNPRELRVAALDNIIFAGTEGRKPFSMAEVCLLFDNSSGKLPLPFTEVAIKRRAFREGESEFFINKNACRLKDIRDLLLDTGLGEGSYSIITQGQVDAILSSKGEERRAIFEEAAGINKYKTRKLAAEKKLIAAEQNILRISDLKTEVSEQLLTLEGQACRAQEYLAVQERIKKLEIGLYKRVLGGLLEKKTKLAEELMEAKKLAERKLAEEGEKQKELESLKSGLGKIELSIDERLVKLDAEKDRLRDLELNRRFIAEEIRRAEKSQDALAEKMEALRQKTEALISETAASGEPNPAMVGNAHFEEILRLLAIQARKMIELLSSITAFFNREDLALLPGRSDIEAAVHLKLDILREEEKRAAAELEQARFALQARREELAQLETAAKPEAKTALFDAVSREKQERDELRRKIAELEDRLIREHGAERPVSAAEISLAKIEGEITGLQEKLSGEYNLTYEEIKDQTYEISNAAKARMEVEEGKARLRSLEPVNLLAIEELKKTRERFSFIDEQITDLCSARESLRNLIAELDRRAEESFVSTMRRLSDVFSETFSKLFIGGEARIALSPGLPPLSAEIEISVRPAGRRWHPMPLLSGGERALAAISILFSLLKIRPSPFCFLDEVDAALDEANIGRFAKLLEDFSSTTQFIMITHNRRSMEIADNIYGVTMQEPGISSVISMKLTEATA